MNTLKFPYRSLAIGIAAIPFVGLSAQTVDTSSDRTPGAEALADAEAQVVSPYIAPADVFVPQSSQPVAAAAGQIPPAHTNYVLLKPDAMPGIQPKAISDLTWPEPAADPVPGITTAEYPASLACIYKMGPTYPGCVPTNNSAYNATGGSGAIAIVIAYRNPTALADLQYFSSFFGLPAPKLKIVRVTTALGGSCATVPTNAGWNLESALDTQWAHAMAPNARIVLVEACDNSYAQLKLAESVAAQQLLTYGGGQVSNSWGSAEWATESADFDDVFRANWQPGKPISYFFSSGDAGLGAGYPSSSPWVVSVGGTTVNRDPTNLYFQSESCWAGSGGGTSLYETYGTVFSNGGTGPWTNFQYPLFGQSNRATPDISFNADPASGAWVYYNGGWYVVGGTSLSAPAVAGIVNNARNKLGVAPINGGYYTAAENNLLYAQLLTQKEYATNFYDVTTGSNGAAATVGWDYCTGVGSPRGRLGK